MDKTNNTQSGFVVTKKQNIGEEKIIFKFDTYGIAKALICFAMQFSGIFSSMSPFGIAFYSSVFSKDNWILCFISSLIGIIASKQTRLWNYALALTAVSIVFALLDSDKIGTALKSVITAVVYLIVGAVRFVLSSFVAFDILALMLEAIFMGVGVGVFTYGFGAIVNVKKRTFYSETENICAFVFVALAILSLQSLPQIAGLSATSVVSILTIYIMCFSCPKSSALTLAVILGVIGSMSQQGRDDIMGTYAFGALLALAFKKYGKTGIVLGFTIANSMAALFLAEAENAVMSIYDSMVAAVAFAVVPQKIVEYVSQFSRIAEPQSGNAYTYLPHHGKGLRKIADSIESLARIYDKTAKEKNIGKTYVRLTASTVCERVCTNCKNKESCFKENGEAIKAIEAFCQNGKGGRERPVLPDELKKICHRCDSFTQAALSCAEIIKTEKQWLFKTNEYRRLISQQLDAISVARKKEWNKDPVVRDGIIEEKIRSELDAHGIVTKEIVAEKNEHEDIEITVIFDERHISKSSRRDAEGAIELVLQSKYEFAGSKRDGSEVWLAYSPQCGYSASFGYSTRAKSGESVCGDSFNVIYTGKNRMVMALSDGMGSGEQAAQESKTTISLLEKFLESGIECDTAVKLINSSLLLKGERDTFATIDICDIDLSEATLGFTKLGAASAYIKRDGKIAQIKDSSLPAGIVREAKAGKHMLPIDSDTVVILMSDGIADIELKNPSYERWIENELLRLESTNPQIIAGKLLERATRISNRNVCDDMTVVAAYISKTKV